MKSVNKIVIMLLVVLLSAPMIQSCKKGEEDPFFSIKTRKGRLAGKWSLKSGDAIVTQAGAITTIIFTDNMQITMFDESADTIAYKQTIEFSKDNTFKRTEFVNEAIMMTEGFWTFMSGYEDIKNKECVILRTKTFSAGGTMQVWDGDDMPTEIIRLRKLTNSDMVVEHDGSSIIASETSITKGTFNYVKQ